jgi:NADH dehydrogenase FAD-containing subunit
MMLDSWLRKQSIRDKVDVGFLTHEKGYIQAFGPRLNDTVTSEFARRRISGRKEVLVERVEPGKIHLHSGEVEEFDVLVSFPPYVASTRFEGLAADDRGFLMVDPRTRQLNGEADIYVVGDAGDFPVKQAFLALLKADAAAEHLSERVLGEQPMAAFDPVSMCIMEQFDKATFAQVPLRVTDNPECRLLSGSAPPSCIGWARGPSGGWPRSCWEPPFRSGSPRGTVPAGPTWTAMEAGVKVDGCCL